MLMLLTLILFLKSIFIFKFFSIFNIWLFNIFKWLDSYSFLDWCLKLPHPICFHSFFFSHLLGFSLFLFPKIIITHEIFIKSLRGFILLIYFFNSVNLKFMQLNSYPIASAIAFISLRLSITQDINISLINRKMLPTFLLGCSSNK